MIFYSRIVAILHAYALLCILYRFPLYLLSLYGGGLTCLKYLLSWPVTLFFIIGIAAKPACGARARYDRIRLLCWCCRVVEVVELRCIFV